MKLPWAHKAKFGTLSQVHGNASARRLGRTRRLNMRWISSLPLTLLILAAGPLLGAEPSETSEKPIAVGTSAPPPRDDNAGPVISKWNLKFEISQEPLRLPANFARSQFIERRYVAEFDVDVPPSTLFGNQGSPAWHSNPIDPAVANLREILRFAPGPQRPSDGLVEEALGATMTAPPICAAKEGHPLTKLRVFAPTADRARIMVQAMLSIYGSGRWVPYQEAYRDSIKADREKLSQERKMTANARAEVADCDKQLESLKGYDDIRAESLVTFTEKRRMLDVDMTYTKARIDACNNILNAREAPTALRIQQAEAIKAAAEIDLAGQEAERTKIETILKNGSRRLELLEKKDKAVLQETDAEWFDEMEKSLATCISERKGWEACPILGGKVVIRPIKWEPPKEDPPKGQGYPPAYQPTPGYGGPN
jgi:hypothetical protein